MDKIPLGPFGVWMTFLGIVTAGVVTGVYTLLKARLDNRTTTSVAKINQEPSITASALKRVTEAEQAHDALRKEMGAQFLQMQKHIEELNAKHAETAEQLMEAQGKLRWLEREQEDEKRNCERQMTNLRQLNQELMERNEVLTMRVNELESLSRQT